MAKLPRVTQRQFASTAGANEIAEFGSYAAASPAFTTDPAVVQDLPNFLEGWFGAVVGGNSPTIEDMNALFFLAFYQLTYLFEEGVPEWIATTTYYTGSIVNVGGVLYKSIIDNNLNNDPSSSLEAWALAIGKGLNPQAPQSLATRAINTWKPETAADVSD